MKSRKLDVTSKSAVNIHNIYRFNTYVLAKPIEMEKVSDHCVSRIIKILIRRGYLIKK